MAEEEKEEVCRALAKYGDRLIESILRATEAERWHLMPELLTNLSAALTLDKQLKCPHSSGQQEELCEQLKRVGERISRDLVMASKAERMGEVVTMARHLDVIERLKYRVCR